MSKSKTKIVEFDNTQDKTSNRVNPKPKAYFEPKVGSKSEVSSSLGETSPSSDNITPNQDIKMDLEPKNWVKNKENYSNDQDKMTEKINHPKKY